MDPLERAHQNARRMSDDETSARLCEASAEARQAFVTAANELRRAVDAGEELYTWVAPRVTGPKSFHVGYPDYSAVVLTLVDRSYPLFDGSALLRELRLPNNEVPTSAEELDRLTLAETVGAFIAIVRGERFSDGVIASTLEAGVLPRAADRIAAAL